MADKIKTMAELIPIVERLKKENKSIVTTNGAFDLFHYGHLKTLRFAKKQGDVLIIALNSDASVKKYKSEKRPIIPEQERTEILAAIEYVDYLVLFDEKTPVSLLERIKPDVHVKGSEYKDNIPERETVEKHGGMVVFIDRHKDDVSTTKIAEKILSIYR